MNQLQYLNYKLLNHCDNVYSFITKKKQLFRGQHVPDFANKILIYYDILYCDPNSIKNGDTVYCDTHQLLQFKDILNQKNNLTIITHNSDFYVCDGDASDGMGINVDLFTCFKKWYAQNSYCKNQSVIPIPIGFENKKWEKTLGLKTKYIETVSKLKIAPTETVYFNCNLSTNLKERNDCLNFSLKSNYVNIEPTNLAYTDYFKKIKQHKFVLSPRGNGLDCHRTWEILKLKRIPVLKREGQFDRLYINMPVLLVDNWDDLNKINLDKLFRTYNFQNQDYLEKAYWFNFCKT